MTAAPWLSVVIPVYNEAENLEHLSRRLMPVLDGLRRPYEVVFCNDGSRDRSGAILKRLHEERPDAVVVVEMHRNFGQHAAIMAGFAEARGEVVLTLDADLQNPPEEIPKLLAAVEAGHDVVGSYRRARQDTTWRHWASKAINFIRARITHIEMRDHGCMLRAYRREIVREIVAAREGSTYIPALAQYFAANPTEVEVEHAARAAGESKYNLYKLIRLNFDLMTGFSLVPLQMFTITGMVVSVLSTLLVVYLALRRLIVGPEAEGVFTLFGILFLLLGVVITGLGIIGEYVGRIFQEVRRRPGYIVRSVARGNPSDGGIALFAYSDVGYEVLDRLIARGERIACVFTHEDDPGEVKWFRSVAQRAQEAGIKVVKGDAITLEDFDAALGGARPELIVSAYYRRMIPKAVLARAIKAAVNLHGSLLPKYRGRAPVNWAILSGETETGITLHHMTGRADAGDIVDQETVAIGPDDTAAEVMARITAAAGRVIERRIAELQAGTAPRIPQDDAAATVMPGRKPEDGRIDWHRPARAVHDLVRAVTRPYPGAFSDRADGRRVTVWQTGVIEGQTGEAGTVLALDPMVVACGSGAVTLIEAEGIEGLQPGDRLAG